MSRMFNPGYIGPDPPCCDPECSAESQLPCCNPARESKKKPEQQNQEPQKQEQQNQEQKQEQK
ncbi:probable serine/threonine-protein kinase DDB_G0281745 [Drosophila serrata]|uniref:probable serine/threonine-protein kinase DDB_G0281745 n=1 Tax=Drosophila serrata TaxID=7274 RepID=UPI000A1D379D|nr:probable serine/threonine-protein kinase DDB_G0281745 [Drosophila serrata]